MDKTKHHFFFRRMTVTFYVNGESTPRVWIPQMKTIKTLESEHEFLPNTPS